MSGKDSRKVHVLFHEVAAYFSVQEWKRLHEWQKRFYENVMKEIHQAMISLGYHIVNPDAVFRIYESEQEFIQFPDHQQRKADINVPASTYHLPINPDLLVRINHEEKTFSKEAYHSEEIQLLHISNTDDKMSCPSALRIKTEEQQIYASVPQDHDGKENFDCCSSEEEHEVISFSIKEEGIEVEDVASDVETQAPERRENTTAAVGDLEENFSEEDQLAGHQRTYTENRCTACKISLMEQQYPVNNRKPSRCNDCESNFSYMSHPLKHQRKRTEKRLFKCCECERSFSRKSHLIRHESIHVREKPREKTFKCTACEKRYFQKSDLVRHQKTHTGERPYHCTDCEKTFSAKASLILHQRTHTGQRPYQCTVCEKRFCQKGTLTIHFRTHTGERPYRCTQCENSYSQKIDLTRHQGKHAS